MNRSPAYKKLFTEISRLSTEQRNPRSKKIDLMNPLQILKVINDEDKLVAHAVEKELKYIAKAVEIVVDSLKNGGRLFYFGAGTSGRTGILDAVECSPTFGISENLVKGIIAGGKKAMFKSLEGSEDRESEGVKDVISQKVGPGDVVCGIAASRRTPYVIGAVKKACEFGARTIYVTTNPRKEFNLKNIDVAICPYVGPEVIMGSTRMKSGTAQKMVLNMLTTASMIKLGKVYENMMVDLKLKNEKLIERAKRIIMISTGLNYRQAERALKSAKGNVKTAIVMVKNNVDFNDANKKLNSVNGFVRNALTK